MTQLRYHTRNDTNFLGRSIWANNADPEEQSHQGIHCLLFHLRHFDRLLWGLSTLCLNFKLITARFSGDQKFMNLTVCFWNFQWIILIITGKSAT